MKTFIFVVAGFLTIAPTLHSQTFQWSALPGAPTNNIKLDDIFFINANTGWVVSGQGQHAIYQTTNGGINWRLQTSINANFRSIGFADSLNGWAGELDGNRIFISSNGGNSWTFSFLPSVSGAGTCGLHVLNNDFVFGCGQVFGPSYFYKTTNGGQSWSAKDMSAYATMLMDCYFFNKDSGFVIGGKGIPVLDSSRNIVLFTSDGGDTWSVKHQGTLTKQWLWKIHFRNLLSGYASSESYRFTDTVNYISTTDGGMTWDEHFFEIDTNFFHAQSILFLNENTGWIGGYICCPVGNGKTYKTTDGGTSWIAESWGINVNRIRYLNDTLLYASGKTVYKYSGKSVSINNVSSTIPENFVLHQNYPNPFNPSTKIKYELRNSNYISIKVFDLQGKEVSTLVEKNLPAGIYETEFEARLHGKGSSLSSGIYFYQMESNGNVIETKKMLLMK